MNKADQHEQHRRQESLKRIQRDILDPLDQCLDQCIISSQDVLKAIEKAEANHLRLIRLNN